MIEPRGRGVLGPPVKPGDDDREGCAHAFFTSLTLEKMMPSARSLV